MAKASQAVILENEFYIIKAPNGKVLEVKNFNTENGASVRLWSYEGQPWQQWQFVEAGDGVPAGRRRQVTSSTPGIPSSGEHRRW